MSLIMAVLANVASNVFAYFCFWYCPGKFKIFRSVTVG